MDIPIDAEGRIDFLPTTTKAGDYVQLRAEMDAVIALSACPQDIIPINSGIITAGAWRKRNTLEAGSMTRGPSTLVRNRS